ncbi:hypothetical protein [Pseudarthrobacter sp. NamB4]|uniref:FIMAH domain-containing protein n=1 Tax=Pseudarthrobacter sp. NamB4 TaxID=2576837 RepID=UPI001484F064|nr:hypothetical protein [Pseudarthrobacter sp. NamB4]
MINDPLRRLLTGFLAAVVAILVLTSCAGQPDLDGGVASQLQQRVATAKQHAAQQDFPTALAELDQLGREVAAAAEQGRMSEQRKNRIEAAIGSIRSELEAAMAPAPEPAPTQDSPAPAPPEKEDSKKQEEEAKKQEEEAKKEAEKQKEEEEKESDKDKEEDKGNG